MSDSLWSHGLPNTRLHSVQFSSVTQSCLTLCNPMYCSMPVFSIDYQLLDLAKTHVYWAIDPIQPSHPLWSPSPPAFNLSQHLASLTFTISLSLLKLMYIELMMPSNNLILCCPLLLLPSVFLSIRVFSNELTLCIGCHSIGASASASILPMNIQGWFPLGLTGLISVLSKGLSSLIQHQKESILQRSAFFMTQLLHLYLTTGKTTALTR